MTGRFSTPPPAKPVDRHRIPPPKDALSDERVREYVVAEVLRDQEAKSMAWRASERGGASRGRIATALVLCLAALYVWLGSPTWLDPPPPPEVEPAHEEAALRLAVVLQAQRVLDFRAAQGRLPDVLWETGEPLPGLGYRRIDARTFELTGTGVQRRVVFSTRDSLGTFAGPARPLVGGTE